MRATQDCNFVQRTQKQTPHDALIAIDAAPVADPEPARGHRRHWSHWKTCCLSFPITMHSDSSSTDCIVRSGRKCDGRRRWRRTNTPRCFMQVDCWNHSARSRWLQSRRSRAPSEGRMARMAKMARMARNSRSAPPRTCRLVWPDCTAQQVRRRAGAIEASTGQHRSGRSFSQSVSQSALCFFSPFTRNIHHIFCSPRSFSCITLLFALAIRTDDAFTHHLPLLLLLVLCFSVPPRTELPASRIQGPLSPGDHATPVLALPVSVNLQYEQMHPC